MLSDEFTETCGETTWLDSQIMGLRGAAWSRKGCWLPLREK